MNNEKTITICGKEVKLRYCAATETGFESLSGKSISVFTPTFGKNDEGNDIVKEPAKATMGDYITLAIAVIAAAYAKENKDASISSKDILYDATPEEVKLLITTVVDLRAEWYNVPAVLEESIKAEQAAVPSDSSEVKEENPKNA